MAATAETNRLGNGRGHAMTAGMLFFIVIVGGGLYLLTEHPATFALVAVLVVAWIISLFTRKK